MNRDVDCVYINTVSQSINCQVRSETKTEHFLHVNMKPLYTVVVYSSFQFCIISSFKSDLYETLAYPTLIE